MSIPSIGQLFQKRMKENPEKNVIGTIENEKINFINFKQYFSYTEKTAFNLQKLNIKTGDKVAILGTTRFEWHIADIASVLSGMVTVPIYPTYSSEDIFYILDHSEIRVLYVENDELFQKVTNLIPKLKNLEVIIMFDELPDGSTEIHGIPIYYFKDILDFSDIPENYLNEKINNLDTSQPASIIYTSGTTGVPKGAVITSDALAQALDNTRLHFQGNFHSEDRTLTWLPLSHVFGRFESFLPLEFNSEMVFAENMEKLLANISLAKPTVMVSVPRIFEKIHAKVLTQVHNSPFIKKKLFEIGGKLSNQFFDYLDRDLSPSPKSSLLRKVFYKLVFSKIYNRFGGRIKFFISGGAPLSPTIIKFLRNCNLCLLYTSPSPRDRQKSRMPSSA